MGHDARTLLFGGNTLTLASSIGEGSGLSSYVSTPIYCTIPSSTYYSDYEQSLRGGRTQFPAIVSCGKPRTGRHIRHFSSKRFWWRDGVHIRADAFYVSSRRTLCFKSSPTLTRLARNGFPSFWWEPNRVDDGEGGGRNSRRPMLILHAFMSANSLGWMDANK